MNPGNLSISHYQKIAELGRTTDAEVCENWLAVSFDSKTNPEEGKVFIYKTNARGTSPALELINTITGKLSSLEFHVFNILHG